MLATGQTGGMQKTLTGLTPGVPVTLTVNLSYASSHINLSVADGTSSNWLASVMANSAGSYTLTFTPTGSTATVMLATNVSFVAASTNLMSVGAVSYSQQNGVSNVPMLVAMSNKANDKYAFGFNGQMKTDEVAGMGNHNTALFWEYDTRTGRRWNLDPKPIIGISQFSTFKLNPIVHPDPNGDIIVLAKGSSSAFALNVYKAMIYMVKHGQVQELRQLMSSSQVYVLKETNGQNGIFSANTDPKTGTWSSGGTIEWNPRFAMLTTNNKMMSPVLVLVHELAHGSHYDKDRYDFRMAHLPDMRYKNGEERRTIQNEERRAATAFGLIKPGEQTRYDHSGSKGYLVDSPEKTVGKEVPLEITELKTVTVKPHHKPVQHQQP